MQEITTKVKIAIIKAGVVSLEGGSLESHLPDEIFELIDSLENTDEIDSFTIKIKDLIAECKIFEKARDMAIQGRNL